MRLYDKIQLAYGKKTVWCLVTGHLVVISYDAFGLINVDFGIVNHDCNRMQQLFNRLECLEYIGEL
jgi:hypothetical protein